MSDYGQLLEQLAAYERKIAEHGGALAAAQDEVETWKARAGDFEKHVADAIAERTKTLEAEFEARVAEEVQRRLHAAETAAVAAVGPATP